MNEQTIITQLIHIFGKNNVLLDDESKLVYGKDFTQCYTPNPLAIVFPKKEKQLIALVELASSMQIGLVPSGGRTGYSGAAVAKNKEIVVAFDKMNNIIDFNSMDNTVKCQPGVITKTIQEYALQQNLYYPVDFASAGSSQIGGNIATNAGGIKVIRYGLTRDWVCGLKVVTGNGDLLELNKDLIKNASGYDFRHLFIGSEGTLGFITEATLQLIKSPKETKVMLFSVPNDNYFIDILNEFQKTLSIVAFEFFSEEAIQHVISDSKLKHPFSTSSPFYILLEYESSTENDTLALEITEEISNNNFISDAIISQNSQQAKQLWYFRENISISILKHFPYKYDIAVTPSKISFFIQEATKLIKNIYPKFEIVWFGHVGDGNLHLNILKPIEMSENDFFSYCSDTSEEVYGLIKKYKGTISAEHGIGLLKKEFLHYTKSDVEVNYMKAIKKVFDHNNIMNPGKLI